MLEWPIRHAWRACVAFATVGSNPTLSATFSPFMLGRKITIRMRRIFSYLTGFVPLFMLAHFSHHLIAALLQPLLPFIRDDFALDYTQAAWIVSAYTLAYGFSQLPGGWLADRIGARTLITMGTSGVAIAGLLVGLSPTYTIMVVFLILLGILGGGYHPAASPLVSATVEEKNRGRALGLHQIGGTASFFLTPLIAVSIATALGEWRGPVIILSVLTLIFGTVLYVLLGKRGFTNKSNHKKAATHDEPVFTSKRQLRLVLFLITGVTIYVAIFSAISFIPLFVVDQFKAGEETGATLLALVHSGGLWAGPLGGYLSDRVGKVQVILAAGFITGPSIYLLSLASTDWTISAVLYVLGTVLFVLGTCMYVAMPVSEAYVISHSSEHNRSTVLGIYFFASRGGPGLIMPVVGYLIDRFSFNTSFTIVGAALLAITLVCSLLLLVSRD